MHAFSRLARLAALDVLGVRVDRFLGLVMTRQPATDWRWFFRVVALYPPLAVGVFYTNWLATWWVVGTKPVPFKTTVVDFPVLAPAVASVILSMPFVFVLQLIAAGGLLASQGDAREKYGRTRRWRLFGWLLTWTLPILACTFDPFRAIAWYFD